MIFQGAMVVKFAMSEKNMVTWRTWRGRPGKHSCRIGDNRHLTLGRKNGRGLWTNLPFQDQASLSIPKWQFPGLATTKTSVEPGNWGSVSAFLEHPLLYGMPKNAAFSNVWLVGLYDPWAHHQWELKKSLFYHNENKISSLKHHQNP